MSKHDPAQYQDVNRWVNVNDAMYPTDGKTLFLAYYNDRKGNYYNLICCATSQVVESYTQNEKSSAWLHITPKHITHWQHLPEPPTT